MRIRWPFALAVAIPASLVACKDSEPQHLDVSVEWSEEHQTIDGFGASSAFFSKNISEEMADQLFDAKKGVGLSLLRVMIGVPDDTKSDGSEPTDGAKPIATAPELSTAQQALSRGAKVWATAWTPPPIWKTTNNKNGSGDGYKTNTLKSENYQAYADYLADFVDLMKKNSVPIVALSPANEPDYIASWDGAQWSGDELAKFVAENLGPTFKSRCPDTEIVTPDTASWPNLDKYVPQLMSKAKDYVPIIATHPYTNGSDPVDLHYSRPRDNGKRFWETEWSQENMNGDTPDPTMTSAIDMMNHMHDHLAVANMNAWNWWAIYISPDDLKSGDEKKVRQNPAFIQPDKNMDKSYMFKRAWAFAHWSKFVRPGFKRIGATDHPNPGVLIEAYKGGNSNIALTAINTGNSAVNQKFTIVDAPSLGSLTAWVTTDSDDMASKGTINNANDTFTYELPPKSVVTFINWDPTKETPNQGTLPIVKADAGTDALPSSACENPMVPNNLENGGVTDFSDYTSQKWGNTSGLWGYKYSYAGDKGSKMGADVDATAKTMHITGSVTSGDYGGAGISFGVCTTVASFTQVQFTLSGSSQGCDMELQLKTYDQTPSGSTPGGCVQDNGSCYNYPVKKKVAVPTSDTQTITATLADFSNWTDKDAAQVVGVQWQWTGNSELDPDSGVGCPIDVTVSNVKFLP